VQRCKKRRCENIEGLCLAAPSGLECAEKFFLAANFEDCSFNFKARAAFSAIATCDAPVVGSQKAATRDIPGTISCNTSNLLALSSGEGW